MLPLLQARIASLWSILADSIAQVTIVRVDYHAFKLKVALTDGSTIHLSEQYDRGKLEQYAYYWLDASRQLHIGWDNAPHHRHLPNFPHHKYVNTQDNLHPSTETTPEQILTFIKVELTRT